MFGKVVSWFGGLFGQVRNRMSMFVALLSVGVVSVLSGEVFAQTATEIPIETPNINWGALPDTIIQALTTPVVVGIGIALSIWVILRALAFFRRTAG
jgi:uncharacterized membrane protein